MKPQRFKPGQEVTPVRRPLNVYANTGLVIRPNEQLQFGRIYKVKRYDRFYSGVWFVDLDGMPDSCSYSEDVL